MKKEYRENLFINFGFESGVVESQIIEFLDILQNKCYEIAKSKGWCDNKNDNKAESIALMHSELSEALEAIRNENPPSEHIPEFSGLEEEMADVVIRVLHFAKRNKLNLPKAIIEKLYFNRERPHKHGGKKF